MATRLKDLPLIVIIGPTASGKTGLAIRLAKKFGGEVICADSRTIYKGMDIGTAKPSHEEQNGVPHWGIDIVRPDETFTAKQFQDYAYHKIDEIRSRGKIPFLVGGAGLYVDAVIYHYEFPRPMTDADRRKFEQMSQADLYQYCIENNIELPINDKNRRHLMRAINQNGAPQKRSRQIESNTFVVGIATEKDTLRRRIDDRTEEMFSSGVVDEAVRLSEEFGWESEAMTSNVYRSLRDYIDGGRSIEEVKNDFKRRDWQLARRQMTWFRRNDEIEWCSLDDAYTYIAHLIATENKS